jgi:hypothetical protein
MITCFNLLTTSGSPRTVSDSTWKEFGLVCSIVSEGSSSDQQQVLTNKDLDLPTQQELLAQFRCDELSAAVLEGFNASSKIVRKPVDAGTVVEGLGALFRDWLSTALGQ